MKQESLYFKFYNMIGLILSLGDEAGSGLVFSLFSEIYVRHEGDL